MNAWHGPVSRGSLAGILLAAAALAAAPATATAHEQRRYSMEILVDGSPLREYAARGTSYIEALAGREYSVRLTNNTAQRVAVALSVDGLNSIDAKTTTARDAARWILDPWQSITLQGWQTSSATARRFFFTTEPQSYGAWLGRTRNLGVITAAVFREHQARPAPIWRNRAPADAPAPPADDSRMEASPESGRTAEARPTLSDEYAATGIGQEVGHSVTRVPFDAEKTPAAVLEVRYEYRDALVRLGVLPDPGAGCEDPLARRERSRGFEGMEFAPDPGRPRRP